MTVSITGQPSWILAKKKEKKRKKKRKKKKTLTVSTKTPTTSILRTKEHKQLNQSTTVSYRALPPTSASAANDQSDGSKQAERDKLTTNQVEEHKLSGAG